METRLADSAKQSRRRYAAPSIHGRLGLKGLGKTSRQPISCKARSTPPLFHPRPTAGKIRRSKATSTSTQIEFPISEASCLSAIPRRRIPRGSPCSCNISETRVNRPRFVTQCPCCRLLVKQGQRSNITCALPGEASTFTVQGSDRGSKPLDRKSAKSRPKFCMDVTVEGTLLRLALPCRGNENASKLTRPVPRGKRNAPLELQDRSSPTINSRGRCWGTPKSSAFKTFQ